VAESERVTEVLLEFIKSRYSGTIVEIGCGKCSPTAIALSRFFEIVATDVLEINAVDHHIEQIYVKDDVTHPNLQLYLDASLIYSIRPPLEIQQSILNLSERVRADSIIKPLESEIIEDKRLRLRNFRGLSLYFFTNRIST
jgi:uncharacterized UPF0146 family protein